MKKAPKLAALVGIVLAWATPAIHIYAQTSSTKVVDETVEWTWAERPEHPDAALPNVLLIGDSITRGYYPEVVKKLQGKANCYLFATSAAAGDPRLPQQLDELFALYNM